MTKDKFIKRVMDAIESGRLEDLEKLYDEIIGLKNDVSTSGGEAVTVQWGTP